MNSMNKYLSILVNDIHSVVCATVDDRKLPVTRVIDIMLADDRTFYFLTAKGKNFYQQLQDSGFIALTGMTGGEGLDRAHASMHKKAVSVRGSVECVGTEKLNEIFTLNPYMAEIYPKKESWKALAVFRMVKGEGEFFDLSTKPITRESFVINVSEDPGQNKKTTGPYFITEKCIGCGRCVSVCSQNCIRQEIVPYEIEQEHCLHCGNCYTDCPVRAVIRR